MRHKKRTSFLFFIFSLFFIAFSFTFALTGASIGFFENFSFVFIIGLLFFLISVIILINRQTLDYIIMIPTGRAGKKDEERTLRAYKEGKKNPLQIYLISGRIDEPKKTSQVYHIYSTLRKYGIKPSNIMIEGKSANTLENVLFTLKKLKDRRVKDLGISSYPLHLDRFEDLIQNAKKQGIVDKNLRIHRLETDTDIKDKIYGVISKLINRYELSTGGLNLVGKSDIKKNIDRIKNFAGSLVKKSTRKN